MTPLGWALVGLELVCLLELELPASLQSDPLRNHLRGLFEPNEVMQIKLRLFWPLPLHPHLDQGLPSPIPSRLGLPFGGLLEA